MERSLLLELSMYWRPTTCELKLAQIVDLLYSGIPVIHVFHEMLDFILAEGYVRVPIQPRGDLYTSGKLDAHSVAILYIGSEGLTDLADLAGQD